MPDLVKRVHQFLERYSVKITIFFTEGNSTDVTVRILEFYPHGIELVMKSLVRNSVVDGEIEPQILDDGL